MKSIFPITRILLLASIVSGENTNEALPSKKLDTINAITLQLLDKSQSISFAGGLKDAVVHLTCFQSSIKTVSSILNKSSEEEKIKQKCCSSFQQSLRELCQTKENDENIFPSLSSSLCMQLQENDLLQNSCENMIALIPNLSLHHNPKGLAIGSSDTMGMIEPKAYLTVRAKIPFHMKKENVTNDADAAFVNSKPTKIREYSLIQYNNYHSGIWNEYIFAYSPLQLEVGNPGFVEVDDQSDDYDEVEDEDIEEEPIACDDIENSISASLQSTLSKTGGMERTFKHIVALYATAKQLSESYEGKISGELNIILPQSQDIFLDLDDPFQNGKNPCSMIVARRPRTIEKNVLSKGTCTASLLTMPNEVIDIEQPSFVSKQHIVAIRLQFEGDAPSEFSENIQKGRYLEVALEISTKVHLRYPASKSDGTNYASAHVPTPFLYDAKLYSMGEDGVKDVHSIHSCNQMSKGIAYRSFSISSGSWESAFVDVAAGVDGHYTLVMAATTIMAILGSLAIYISMSNVSVWK